ncbi:MAG: hypothetical protein RJB05_1327 [Armatimonadota bacterium]
MKGANGFFVNRFVLACRNIILLLAVMLTLAAIPANAQDSLVLESSIQMISVAQSLTPDTHSKSCMCADCNHMKCCCKAMTDSTPVFRPVCALPSTTLLNASTAAPRCVSGSINLTLDGGLTSLHQVRIVSTDMAAQEWSSRPPLAPPRG